MGIDPKDHVGLVALLAKQYAQRVKLPLEELIQEGTLGLIAASKKFDPTRGVAFSTYAAWWIRAAMKTAAVEKGRLIKIPVHAAWRLHKEGNLPPTPQSLDGSLPEARTSGDKEPVPWHEFLADEDSSSPEDVAALRERKRQLSYALRRLPKRTQEILRMRFVEEKTLEEIGEFFGVSRERIRQVEGAALKRLREALGRSKGLAA